MNLFSKKPGAADARVAGEMLATRLALTTLLEVLGADFPIAGDLSALHKAGVEELKRAGASTSTAEGFDEFMRGFIAAARKHN